VDNRDITVTPSFAIVALFVKANAATGLMGFVNGMPVGDAGEWDDSNAWTANCIQSVGTGTFQLGSDAQCNADTVSFHYMAFGTNAQNDLAVGNYSGNGADNRDIVTSPAFQPGLVWIVNDAAVFTRWRTADLTGDNACGMTGVATCANADTIQALNADGFEVGTSNTVNASGTEYAYFALKAGATRFWTHDYTGNATDNTAITGAGFQPEFTWTKCTATCSSPVQYRLPTQTGDNTFPALLGQQSNRIQQFLSDGFELGSDNTVNQNTITYYSWSFATQPAGGGGSSRRGRPTWFR
jgi:hypothetical protein